MLWTTFGQSMVKFGFNLSSGNDFSCVRMDLGFLQKSDFTKIDLNFFSSHQFANPHSWDIPRHREVLARGHFLRPLATLVIQVSQSLTKMLKILP